MAAIEAGFLFDINMRILPDAQPIGKIDSG